MKKRAALILKTIPSEAITLVSGMVIDTAKLTDAEYRDALSIGILEMLKTGRLRWPDIKVS